MNWLKDEMIKEEAQGFSDPPKKSVCVKHLSDSALRSFLASNANAGQCSYCGASALVIPLYDLVNFMAVKIHESYDHPDNEGVGYDSSVWSQEDGEEDGLNHEYGYVLQDNRHVYNTDELFDQLGLYDDVNLEELRTDIVGCFPDTLWCQKDPYGMTEDEEMSFKWRLFCDEVKHQRRYTFFQNPDFDNPHTSENGLSDILSEISGVVHTTHLVQAIPAGTKLYRCRNHNHDTKIDKVTDLVSPLPEQAIYPNRMSPAGIPMFYGGFDSDIVRQEAQGNSECQTVGEFELREDINVIDFTNLPRDVSFWGDVPLEPIRFLYSFVSELSKPISPGDVHIEYVPTQILTEHFRYNFLEMGVQGMIYESAKCKGQHCCVLFLNQEECLQKMNLTKIEKFSL